MTFGEKMDVVRRIHDTWNRGESVRKHLADDIEYVNPDYAVEPGTRRGPGAFATVLDTYADFTIDVDRLVDAGGDDVVVLAHIRASGPGSGVPVEGEQGYVWTIQNGLAVRFRWFGSHREALDAAGLSI